MSSIEDRTNENGRILQLKNVAYRLFGEDVLRASRKIIVPATQTLADFGGCHRLPGIATALPPTSALESGFMSSIGGRQAMFRSAQHRGSQTELHSPPQGVHRPYPLTQSTEVYRR